MTEQIKKLNKPDKSFFTGMGFPLLIIANMSYLLSYGYVGYKLWNWFVLPIISNHGVITVPLAIGLFLLIRLFTSKFDIEKFIDSKSEEQIGLMTISAYAAPWLSLFIGYLVKFLLL